MKTGVVFRCGVIFGLVLSIVALTGLASALAQVRVANVREYEMRRHIQRGEDSLSETDDTYPQLAESLDSVVRKGVVTWGDRGRMEKASLVKVKIRVPDKDLLRAFGLQEVRAIKDVIDPEQRSGWSTVAFEEANGAAPSLVAFQVDSDGSIFQMIKHVAVKVDGVFHRLPLREDGYGAFSVTQNYLSYLADAGKLKDWVANRLGSQDGVSILVVRREDRRRFQQRFSVQDLARPDRAYVILALGEEGLAGGEDYEIVFGWEQRKLSLGGGSHPFGSHIGIRW